MFFFVVRSNMKATSLRAPSPRSMAAVPTSAKASEEGKDICFMLEQASNTQKHSLTPGSSNVWLRTIKADKPDMMMDIIFIYIGHGEAARTDDLAKGASGDYRFLDWTRNMTATR
ncbi:uncharacterized protein BKA55DRAFT_538590 [Fusarium redolens]|jgi:hypothetical protein|uniref:Uncharacterized protein n=1 Tax=Fusarium redolens TaxID=48865 RepID=A0A9P9HA19_FUSRE|nr:uncharacterized protein BKA55DRAFT_538590 [Fusarium redolens]KAH7253726.1 hypothetical protein BKA55DRAFT_538590 [Fusarium redolens]